MLFLPRVLPGAVIWYKYMLDLAGGEQLPMTIQSTLSTRKTIHLMIQTVPRKKPHDCLDVVAIVDDRWMSGDRS